MKPTILFDMDGVIVRSEQLWNECEPGYLRQVLDPSIAEQIIGKTRGCSVSMIYEWAKKLGYAGEKREFYQGYNTLAVDIYTKGPITPGIDALIGGLQSEGVHLGLVSSSPKDWIMAVVNRLSYGKAFEFIESVDDHPDLRPKPSPDGYIAAMKALSAIPQQTLIIEDSQTGINAAIASGAHVCCFAIHNERDESYGADTMARTIEALHTACFDFIGLPGQ